jgi:hypothetical protein
MTSYETKLALLEKKEKALQKRQNKLMRQSARLREETEKLKAERLIETLGMPEKELALLKRLVTIVGTAMSSPDVHWGGLKLEDAESEDLDHPYSIHMETSVGNEYECVIGLCMRTTIKTKSEAVRQVVRNMISSTGYEHEEEKGKPKNYWHIYWDDYDAIEVKTPYTSEDHTKDSKKFPLDGRL